MCQDTILFASLFNPEVQVPADMVTATVSKRQVDKPIGGTAGRKKRRLIEERACNETTMASKVKYLKAAAGEPPSPPPPAPAREFVLPAQRPPSPSDDDFEVHTPVAADGRPD